MFCSLFFASWLCFRQPAVSEPIIYEHKAIATAYNLETSQTDEEPCIGAGNHDLCRIQKENPGKCIIATRLYDLHTVLYVKEVGRCEVLDRTSKKYGSRIDFLMETREEAIKFGKKEVEYIICED